uniref:RWD domain-containing protein n=1 Tax=Syphacia muris TaxID=451379 RepID=A0A0N5AL60_9BILA
MSQEEVQLQEIEALEAIYPGELEVIDRTYPNISIIVNLTSHLDENIRDESCVFTLKLSIGLPPDYPEVLPILELIGLDELFTEKRINEVLKELHDVANDSLGMPMVFTVISTLQDNIGFLVEDLKNEREVQKLKKQDEEEELAKKKFEGCPVTPETFREWKLHFDVEIEARIEKERKAREATLSGKLTGRQLFLRDTSLNLSDFAVMEAAANVEIDESLFDEVSDLDDLELEDEEVSQAV